MILYGKIFRPALFPPRAFFFSVILQLPLCHPRTSFLCHPSFSASLNVKGSSLLPSPLSKGEPVGSNISHIFSRPPFPLSSSGLPGNPDQIKSLFFTSPSEGQEERKQSSELFSDDWGRTVNLRPSNSDGSKCYSAADRRVLPSWQHLRSQTVDTTCRVRVTNNLPYILPLKTQGWRQKISPVEIFSTTGESLLAHKLAAATRNERYKPSDRSDLAIATAELRSQKARRVSFILVRFPVLTQN